MRARLPSAITTIDRVMRVEIFSLPYRWQGSLDEAIMAGRLSLLGGIVFESPRDGRWLGAKLSAATKSVGGDRADVVWLVSRPERPVELLRPAEWGGGAREAGYAVVAISDASRRVLGAYAACARSALPARTIGRFVCYPTPGNGDIVLRTPTLPLHQVFGDAVIAAGGRLGIDQAGEYASVPRSDHLETMLRTEEANCRQTMGSYCRYRSIIDNVLRQPRMGLRFDVAAGIGEVSILPPESVDRSRLFLLLDASDVPHLGVTVGSGSKTIRNSKQLTETEAAMLGIELSDPDEPCAAPTVWRLAVDLNDGYVLPPDLHRLGGVIRYTGDVVEAIQADCQRRLAEIAAQAPADELDGVFAEDLLDADVDDDDDDDDGDLGGAA